MAAVRLKCTFFGYFSFFCALLVSAKASNDFVHYQVDEHRSLNGVSQIDIVLLERNRRYVETAIPRLADNYYRQETYPGKNLDKDDIDSFSRRRGRMEMLGNLAVNADELAMSSINSGGSVKDHLEVSENVPEKATKKPTSAGVKKNLENPPGKTILNEGDSQNVVHNVSLQNSNKTATTYDVSATTWSSSTTQRAVLGSSSDQSVNNASTLHQVEHEGMKDKTIADDGTSQSDYTGLSEVGTTSDFTDTDFPKDITNNTLLKNNITEKQVDRSSYYNSTFIMDSTIAKQYWVEMEKNGATINKMLSKSHRRAATVKLSFEFPFYGHMVQKVTIATGGFLYTGDHIHSWLAATHYIAPLMANFDTGLSDESQVRYLDNGTSFTVEWDRVHLQDKQEAGQFTFQVTLHKNGDIVFVYKDVPILVENIEDCQHPVKVGLSDAYILDRTVFFVRRKTIYEYHRVNFKREDIKNWTVIYMTALPTCLSYTDCKSCIAKDTTFDCKWCGAVERCSSGYDRYRQEWQLNQCEHFAVNTTDGCHLASSNASNVVSQRHLQITNSLHKSNDVANSQAATDINIENSQKSGHLGHSGLLGLLFFVLIISGLSLWLLYAYRNPHTTSGQVLIKYRPSQWTLRRGEARYTAASIHM